MKCMPVLFLSQMQLLVVLICIFISLVHLCNSLATNGNALKSVLAKHNAERLLKLIETRTIKIIPTSRENSKLIKFRWIPDNWNQVQKYQGQFVSWCVLFKASAQNQQCKLNIISRMVWPSVILSLYESYLFRDVFQSSFLETYYMTYCSWLGPFR